MLALIYLGLAIVLGDLLCRRFYRFVSTAHRWAAATLVGILLSTWLTYLAGLAFAHTSEPLLSADLLFFFVAPSAIFWLSKQAEKTCTIAPRRPGSSRWDWIMLGALFTAACVLLIGTLYINKQDRLRLADVRTSEFARQLAITQNLALGHDFPTELLHYVNQRTYDQFLFYFQAGNLQFLGLNLAWSVDLLSLLGLMSALALVMALGEALFNAPVVGRLGATFFFFHGSFWRPSNFLSLTHRDREETWGQLAFVSQRHLPFAVGIFLLVLIFLIDQYQQRSSAAETSSDMDIALRQSKRGSNWTQLKTRFASRFTTSGRAVLTTGKSVVFSALLLAMLPLLNAHVFMAVAVALACLFLAYGFCRLSSIGTAATLGRILAGALTAYILATGVTDLLAVFGRSPVEVNYDKEPLVKGLGFRNSVVYKIQDSFPPRLEREDSSKTPVTAFEGGHGDGRGQFDSPRGIATDTAGNILVADTGNGRIEKFSPNGSFLSAIGTKGTGRGQLGEPNGIAVDRAGSIYVAEVASNHRVQKLAADGTFIDEWKGPPPGFYGPRRIAIGPDDSVYVVDQGRTRIVKFTPDGHVVAAWGSGGSGDGQFSDPTSVAVDSGTNKVYVADPRNRRIQIFDSNGTFQTKWLIPEWGRPDGFEDLVIDSQRGCLYASSANMNKVLVFDLQGNRLGTMTPTSPDKLDGPSALALSKDKLLVLNAASGRVSDIPLRTKLGDP